MVQANLRGNRRVPWTSKDPVAGCGQRERGQERAESVARMTGTVKRQAMPATCVFPRLLPRHALLLAVGLALMLRILIPGGWMPVADAHGLRLVLCGGSAVAAGASVDVPSESHHAATHHQKSGDKTTHTDQPCAFAGMALPWTGAEFVALSFLLPVEALASPIASELVAIGHGLVAPPPPATGPPATF